MNQLLDINNLSIKFNTSINAANAVNNVSFSVARGETLGIVGESGSGKSVSCLSILGLLPMPPAEIASGEIVFHKNENESVILNHLSQKQLRQYRGQEIAMIFQEPMTSLNPVYTCGNQVVEAIMLHQKLSKKDAKRLTFELFNEVHLPRPEEIFRSYPHQISGGQKQRVMIAMAISCKPSLLIADEPTTALDVTVQKTILELLQNLQQKYKMGIIFITHDLSVIAGIADRIAVMYKGTIVEQGNAKTIFNNPQHPYTKALLACRPKPGTKQSILPTVSDFMTINKDGTIVEKNSELLPHTSYLIPPNSYLTPHTSVLIVNNLKNYFPINKSKFKLFTRYPIPDTQYVKAVDSVSFEVYAGETLGLVGESGCGKTTLGRTILSLIKPTSGEVIYKGINIATLTPGELRRLRKELQIVFQDPYSSLNPHISIGEAIVEPMQVHKIFKSYNECRTKALSLLEKVSLPAAYFNRYPHELSGGQRQRVCIARALALNPQFIICDESVSALDVSVQAQVLNLLNQLKQEFGFTYIFISHDLSVVRFMSDRIIVMHKGQIVEIGQADEVYTNPQSLYTQKLIASIPTIT